MIKFSISNKGRLLSINENTSLSNKILDLKKSFLEILPEIKSEIDIFLEIIKKDFVLLNFSQIEHFLKFFNQVREYINSKKNIKPIKIWQFL